MVAETGDGGEAGTGDVGVRLRTGAGGPGHLPSGEGVHLPTTEGEILEAGAGASLQEEENIHPEDINHPEHDLTAKFHPNNFCFNTLKFVQYCFVIIKYQQLKPFGYSYCIFSRVNL